MPSIRFVLTPIPPAAPQQHVIEQRWATFLENLRRKAAGIDEDLSWIEDDLPEGRPTLDDLLARVEKKVPQVLTSNDRDRIRRRAATFVARNRAARAPHEQLKEQLRQQVEGLRDLPVCPSPGPHRVDEIAAELHEEMPWFAPATTALMRALRLASRRDAMGVHMPPLLLVGPAGIGKTAWAAKVAEILAVPFVRIDGTGEPASWSVTGVQRGWASGEPGRVLSSILRDRVANPIVFIDEVEKAGRPSSSAGATFALDNALLPLLEPSTARSWTCPYFRMQFDMSRISWILAANTLDALSEPFLSRMRVIHLRAPTVPELVTFCTREGERRGMSDAAIDAVGTAIGIVVRKGMPMSLREALRMLDLAEELEGRPMLI